MGDKSKIEWTEASWTPIRARVRSDAREIAETKGYTSLLPIIQPGRVGPHCERVSPGCQNCYSETNNARCLPNNGTGLPFNRQARDLIDIFMDEKILKQPLHWKRPRRIFVCSQTDLFGKFVPAEFIVRVLEICGRAPQHTFQVLTKRPERMKELMCDICAIGKCDPPPPNIWLGVSIEDQKTADERIPLLLQTPAAVRWVSYEPALGPVDFTPYVANWTPGNQTPNRVQWIVAGGESGSKSRPSHPDWFRDTRDMCQAAEVPFFFKQWGEWADMRERASQHLPDSHIHRWPDGKYSFRIRKKKAGRLLDGREWNEYPKVPQ